MKEFAFDIKLWATARVNAEDEKDAREKMCYQLNCVDINYNSDDIKITEASIEDDDDSSELIEIDGQAV